MTGTTHTKRQAQNTRHTKETEISVAVNLDGTGLYKINTGIGFLDHMLEQLSRHSLIDIELSCKGDLHIDAHHSTEDSGIALGQAIKEALGDKSGIRRYGACLLPMDEALSRVVLDFSNRPYLVWNVSVEKEQVGNMDWELFREWFQAFATQAGLTLHVESLYGFNSHHIIESIFKALAKALREAIEIDPAQDGKLPSTKGLL